MTDKSSFERLISQDRRFQVFNDTVPAGTMVLRVDDGKVVFTNRFSTTAWAMTAARFWAHPGPIFSPMPMNART